MSSCLILPTDKSNKPSITITFTLVSVVVSFAWLGVEGPDKWKIGVGLYIVGCGYYNSRFREKIFNLTELY
jgi:hypothetical protein